MPVHDTSVQFTAQVNKDLVKRFTKAGVYFTSKLRNYLNTAQAYKKSPPGHYHGFNPSSPGQFPHKLSGQLVKSMTWELDARKLVLTCGSNLSGYPAVLETGSKWMQPRPWLTKGFALEKPAILKILTGK